MENRMLLLPPTTIPALKRLPAREGIRWDRGDGDGNGWNHLSEDDADEKVCDAGKIQFIVDRQQRGGGRIGVVLSIILVLFGVSQSWPLSLPPTCLPLSSSSSVRGREIFHDTGKAVGRPISSAARSPPTLCRHTSSDGGNKMTSFLDIIKCNIYSLVVFLHTFDSFDISVQYGDIVKRVRPLCVWMNGTEPLGSSLPLPLSLRWRQKVFN